MEKKPLVVIPTYLIKKEHLDQLMETIKSILLTAPNEVEVLVVDDGSPAGGLRYRLKEWRSELPYEVELKKTNTGFSSTVNIGLERALDEERDVVLVNSDIEMQTPGWVENCRETLVGNVPAAVVGALLIYPQSGLIQHAGINFSFLSRRFFERFKYAPQDLPAALVPKSLPVTGAFQYIRYETLARVGIYDADFHLGFEDVDYCVRAYKAGLDCVYNPNIRAFHHESMVRGKKTPKIVRWEAESWQHFVKKYANEDFARFVPAVL